MQAYVYKSQRKPDTYLYLAARDDFGCLPQPLLASLQPLVFVLDVALTAERTLARADPRGGTREPGRLRFPSAIAAAARRPDRSTR